MPPDSIKNITGRLFFNLAFPLSLEVCYIESRVWLDLRMFQSAVSFLTHQWTIHCKMPTCRKWLLTNRAEPSRWWWTILWSISSVVWRNDATITFGLALRGGCSFATEGAPTSWLFLYLKQIGENCADLKWCSSWTLSSIATDCSSAVIFRRRTTVPMPRATSPTTKSYILNERSKYPFLLRGQRPGDSQLLHSHPLLAPWHQEGDVTRQLDGQTRLAVLHSRHE